MRTWLLLFLMISVPFNLRLHSLLILVWPNSFHWSLIDVRWLAWDHILQFLLDMRAWVFFLRSVSCWAHLWGDDGRTLRLLLFFHMRLLFFITFRWLFSLVLRLFIWLTHFETISYFINYLCVHRY
jgi:hypothetical protein